MRSACRPGRSSQRSCSTLQWPTCTSVSTIWLAQISRDECRMPSEITEGKAHHRSPCAKLGRQQKLSIHAAVMKPFMRFVLSCHAMPAWTCEESLVSQREQTLNQAGQLWYYPHWQFCYAVACLMCKEERQLNLVLTVLRLCQHPSMHALLFKPLTCCKHAQATSNLSD